MFLNVFTDGSLEFTTRQYAGIGILLVIALVAQAIYVFAATLYIRGHAIKAHREFWRKERQRIDRVIFGLFIALAISIGTPFLDFDPDVEDAVEVGSRLLGAVCGGLLLLRAIAILGDYLLERAGETETRLDDQLIPLVRQTANVFVVLVGTLFVLSNLDVDVAALVAGLGIGGLAVALAAQDTIKNLLGGITVLADRPFQVGDWIVVGDVEGTVEKIGFRSTRVRTFRGSLVSVPNARLTDTVIDNIALRPYRRYDTTLHLPLSTPPDAVQAFCEGVRALFQANAVVRQDYYFCELNRFGESTLEVLLYCFFDASDWAIELRAKHILNLDIIRLAEELGIDLAPPAQVVQVARHRPRSAQDRDGLGATVARLEVQGAAGQAAHRPFTHGFEPRPELAKEVNDNSSDDSE